MTDPLADLLADEQLERDTEREERSIVLRWLKQIVEKLDELKTMERTEQAEDKPDLSKGFTITVTERDENGQIKSIKIT